MFCYYTGIVDVTLDSPQMFGCSFPKKVIEEKDYVSVFRYVDIYK
jgi:hypothetical protein